MPSLVPRRMGMLGSLEWLLWYSGNVLYMFTSPPKPTGLLMGWPGCAGL